MKPILPANPIQKYLPSGVKFHDLYRQRTGYKSLPASEKNKISQVLSQAGYRQSEINRALNNQSTLPIIQAKKIISALSQGSVKGFADANANKLVNTYLKKEAVKRKNLARVIGEHAKEARQEPLPAKNNGPKPKIKLTF